MREIALDTETTGLNPDEGHRIVEIGAVELWNHLPTGKTYHEYVNPERDMPEAAFAVHGLSRQFLADKPGFKDIAKGFLAFVGDDRMIIHNAGFDMRFLNAELGRCQHAPLPMVQTLDTLEIARRKFPGSPASLDALCRRFGIVTAREKHGALLDAEILADVYLELIGGRQPDFALVSTTGAVGQTGDGQTWTAPHRPHPLAPRLTPEEREAHVNFIAGLGENAFWKRFC